METSEPDVRGLWVEGEGVCDGGGVGGYTEAYLMREGGR